MIFPGSNPYNLGLGFDTRSPPVIKGHFGSHSMRKSFGRFQRKNGIPIEMLMHRFNHSTIRQTLNYLGITAEETKNMLLVDPFNG